MCPPRQQDNTQDVWLEQDDPLYSQAAPAFDTSMSITFTKVKWGQSNTDSLFRDVLGPCLCSAEPILRVFPPHMPPWPRAKGVRVRPINTDTRIEVRRLSVSIV